MTAQEAGRCGLPDPDQLQFATAQERVVMTFDPDYLALHASSAAHAGIVWRRATKYTIGQLIQLLFFLHQVTDRDGMCSLVEYLREEKRAREHTRWIERATLALSVSPLARPASGRLYSRVMNEGARSYGMRVGVDGHVTHLTKQGESIHKPPEAYEAELFRQAEREASVALGQIVLALVGLGLGVFLAAVYGGMSRSIAQRHKTDLLTAFLGGALGVFCLMRLAGYLIEGGGSRSSFDFGMYYLLLFIVSLVVFWLGGTYVGRFVKAVETRGSV